ncbi:MAG: hypothetical protein U0871_15380 [Gemmataceae bacterium]
MSEWYKVGGRFTLRHGDTERVYRVRDAVVTFVRHPDGTALALTVDTDAESPGFGPESAEYPIGPSLAVVLNGANENRGVPARWVYGPTDGRDEAPGNQWPKLYLYDMHLINRLTVEVSEALDKQLVRLDGTAGGFTFRVTACARFGGVSEYTESGPPGSRWWAGHVGPAATHWPAGEPLTEAIWQGTAEFRRLVRGCFPRPAPMPQLIGPPEWRIAAFARRLGLLPPHPPPLPRQILLLPFGTHFGERQTQLLLAALVEHYLADGRPNGSPDEFRQVARVIERFADGVPTAADRQATAPVIGRTCLVGSEMFLNDYSPSSARSLFQFAHMDPDVGSQMLIQGLFPERCQAGCDLLRDILGDPFRPVLFAPRWRTETVAALAEGIYHERAFDRLPILADALEEAGCEDERVLAHCREPGLHARGCWVVDGIRWGSVEAQPTRNAPPPQ